MIGKNIDGDMEVFVIDNASSDGSAQLEYWLGRKGYFSKYTTAFLSIIY